MTRRLIGRIATPAALMATTATVLVMGAGPGPATAQGPVALAATTARQVSPGLFGMHPAVLTGALSAAQLAGVTPASGISAVTIVANGGGWSSVQPTAPVAGSPAVYDWTALDQAVANARSRGIGTINLLLAGTPLWAAAYPAVAGEPSPGYTSPPTTAHVADWRAYVRAVALRYNNRITSYQVWAEADLKVRWRGTPAQLADLTLAAYQEIKRVNPAVQVVAASTTTRLHNLGTWFYPYLRELARRGWPVNVYAGNFYPASTGSPVTRQAQITQFRAYLAKAAAPVKPIWDGEINYGTIGPAPLPRVALDNGLGAAYVVRTYLDSLRLGISRVYWSAWTPRGPVYGVTMWPGSPGAAAQRTAYAWLAGKWWRGCTTTAYSTGAFLSCKVTTTTSARSAVATIAWSEGAARRMAVPAGDHHICNAVGACTLTAPGRVVTVGVSPLRFAP